MDCSKPETKRAVFSATRFYRRFVELYHNNVITHGCAKENVGGCTICAETARIDIGWEYKKER